jgi:hypothetical protein
MRREYQKINNNYFFHFITFLIVNKLKRSAAMNALFQIWLSGGARNKNENWDRFELYRE